MNTILFDFDGTIANSLSVVIPYLQRIAPTFGLSADYFTNDATIADSNASEIFKKLSPEKQALFFQDLANYISANIQEIAPYPGILPLLHDLHAANIRLSILSSNQQKNIDTFVNLHKVAYFEPVIGQLGLLDKTEILLKFSAQWKINPVLFITDEVRDIHASKRANIPVAAVTWGYNNKKSLQATNPDFIIDTPAELRDICLAQFKLSGI